MPAHYSNTSYGIVPASGSDAAAAGQTRRETIPPPQHGMVPWYDLPPELMEWMSRYADIGSDLTGLCVVVGSVSSALIRKEYLTDNDAYLAYALSLTKSLKQELTQEDNAACFDRAASRIRSWMTVNTNWRDRCDKISFQQHMWHFALAGSLLQHKISFGRRVIIDDNGPRAVQVDDATITYPIECIFTSPIIATILGLVEVVKTLLDKRFFGVNDFLPLRNDGHDHHRSLVSVALTQSINKSVLRFLLSRDDFDLNAPWHQDDPHNKPLHLATRVENADPEALKMILDHPNCSAEDVAENGTGGESPLHYLCKHTNDRKYAVAKMKMLLAAGADPELQDVSGRTPRDHLIVRLNNAGTEEDIELTAELLVTLQKAILARRV